MSANPEAQAAASPAGPPEPVEASAAAVLGQAKIFHEFIGPRAYLVLALSLLAALLESLGIVLLVPLLASLDMVESGSGGLAGWAQTAVHALGLHSAAGILGLIALVFVAKGLILFAASTYKAWLQAKLMRDLQLDLFHGCMRMSLPYYTQRATGHFMNVMQQTGAFLGGFQALSAMAISALNTLVYLAMAMMVAWLFGVMALLVGGAIALLFRLLNRRIRDLSRAATRHYGVLYQLLIQGLQGFKYLSSTARAKPLEHAVRSNVDALTVINYQQGMLAALVTTMREPLAVICIIAIVLVQLQWLQQPLAPILVSILLFYRGVNAVLGIQNSWQRALALAGPVELIRDEFRALQRHREGDGTQTLPPLQQGIELQGVAFEYQPDRGPVLSEVNLQIPACATVALVGASGAGKSTLVDLLTLMQQPSAGRLLIDGLDGRDIQRDSWRRQIGFVPQDPVVFDDSIAQNICLWQGDPKQDPDLMRRIREAARLAALDGFIDSLPQGYDSLVGDRGLRLSGGQRQRLCIARELFREPRLLILDEATSSLDGESEAAIQHSIDALHGRLTVVIIAHRLATVRAADRIFVLDAGRVVESGRFDELSQQPGGRFAAMVARQDLLGRE